MNEQIKKLCEQSKVYANESTKDFTGNEPVVWMDYYTEKFAELIVSECIRLCDQVDIVGADECIDNIKEQFGIKK